MAQSSTYPLEYEYLTSRVLQLIQELVQSRRQLVMTVVARSRPGHNVDVLARTLRYEVDRRASRFTAVQWVPLQFPQLRDRLYANLEYELETQLSPRPGEMMQEMLTRIAPLPSEASQRILWLDWGSFRDAPDDRRRLTHHEMQIWLQFCSDFLTVHCPRGVRIVSYLAIEATSNDGLDDFLAGQRQESWCKRPEMRLRTLLLDPEDDGGPGNTDEPTTGRHSQPAALR